MRKLLWVGDAACASGFARCTHAACDALHDDGWDVKVLGINYYGDPQASAKYPYEIWPCVDPLDEGRDQFGVHRLPRFIERHEPDVVVLLNDPWNVPVYSTGIDEYRKQYGEGESFPDPRIIGWLAVDAENTRADHLNRLDSVATWTDFGLEELRRRGFDGVGCVVPLGVDSSIYRPMNKTAERRAILPSETPGDAFIVGYVGRNQMRKRLDLLIEYFAEWVKGDDIDDAYLFIHSAPTGNNAFHVAALTHFYGIQGKVIQSSPTNMGHGIDEEQMAQIYSIFDVYLTTTQGEGWGLPVLEAMSCGVPAIVPDFAGLGDWTGTSAVKISCTARACNAPLQASSYTVGAIPDKLEMITALREMYHSQETRQEFSRRGLELAQQLTWERTGAMFAQFVDERMALRKVV